MTGIPFTKGHGTENDFVVLPDPDGALDLTAARVAALCDRRRGLGADGVLRVVRWAALKDDACPAEPGVEWFMDYRNADGSAGRDVRQRRAGLRRYWSTRRLAARGGRAAARHPGRRPRGAVRPATAVAVDMGPARDRPGRRPPTVGDADVRRDAVDVGNPHLALRRPTSRWTRST